MSEKTAAPGAAGTAVADGESVVTVTKLVAGYLPGVNILNGCSIEARKILGGDFSSNTREVAVWNFGLRAQCSRHIRLIVDHW